MSSHQSHKPTLPLLGAHISISRGYRSAFHEAVLIGGSAVQIFSSSPMRFNPREITNEEGADVAELPERGSIGYAVIHGSYLINYAKKLSKDSYEFKALEVDLKNADTLRADGVILHMGKALKENALISEDLFVKNVEHVLENTKGLKSKIIIEIMAGQGSEMDSKIEDFGRMLEKFKNHTRIGVCIDTCHIFAGGHDISQKNSADEAVTQIGKHIGFDTLSCVHFNDAKQPFGSHKDRHEDIGHGTIGEEALEYFMKELLKKRKDLPFILETTETYASYTEQIALIQSWF